MISTIWFVLAICSLSILMKSALQIKWIIIIFLSLSLVISFTPHLVFFLLPHTHHLLSQFRMRALVLLCFLAVLSAGWARPRHPLLSSDMIQYINKLNTTWTVRQGGLQNYASGSNCQNPMRYLVDTKCCILVGSGSSWSIVVTVYSLHDIPTNFSVFLFSFAYFCLFLIYFRHLGWTKLPQCWPQLCSGSLWHTAEQTHTAWTVSARDTQREKCMWEREINWGRDRKERDNKER